MKSKWLRFKLIAKGHKTSVWSVENTAKEEVGLIKWNPHWRKYCYMSEGAIIFSQRCLRDVADFIKEQMDKRKKNARG